jgi:hypothetical protein
MDAENRSNYRAKAIEDRPAWLVIGRCAHSGLVLDESAGGFCFLATSDFPIEENSEGWLTETDGVPIAVFVAHVERTALRARIGLRRNETPTAGAHRQKSKPRMRGALVGMAVAAGLAIGLLIIRGPRLF